MSLKFKILFLFSCAIFFSPSIYSQLIDPDATGYYTEALRFSQTMNSGGTARFQAMGGPKSALGADLSSLSGNPAGLGLYKRSEASISTAFGFAGTTSSFLNNSFKDQRDYFNFPNLGLVFSGRKDEAEEGPFRGGAFGIGLTRINNFQNQFSYSGVNKKNSMTDYFVDISNGIPQQDLFDEFGDLTSLQGLAYWTFLIDDDVNTSDQYVTYNKGTTSKQQETVFTRGAMNQWNFTYGGSFDDKVYIGASLGIPMIRSITEKNYGETVIDNDTMDMNFDFSELVKVRGTGVNFKLGVILKPEDWIRIGVSLQSPTYYSIKEDYDYGVSSFFDGVTSVHGVFLEDYKEKTSHGTYKYNLSTPFRAAAGIALFAGKTGFLAADIEYVPYSHTKLKESSLYNNTTGSSFTGDNNTIKNLYKSALNLNIGGELRYKIYRFRGGFGIQGDAYNNIDNINRRVINISGGTGIRMDEYYFDIALVNSRYNSLYKPYTLNNGEEPIATVKNSNTSFVITAGVFF